MRWVRNFNLISRSIPVFPIAIAAVCLSYCALSAQNAADKSDLPFTIEKADKFYQRKDSLGQSRFILEGDVRISRGVSSIACGFLTYAPGNDIAIFVDSVVYIDTAYTFRSDTLFYNLQSELSEAFGSLRWKSSMASGSGDRGKYFRVEQVLEIEGNAVAGDTTYRIESDKLHYDLNAEELTATGKVKFTHLVSGSTALASAARYNRNLDRTVLSGRPEVEMYEESDTAHSAPYRIVADRIVSFAADSMIATGRVRLWDDSVEVIADSLFHDEPAGRSFFRGERPEVRATEFSLAAGSIDALTEARKLRRVVAVRDAHGEFYNADDKKSAKDKQEPSWLEGDTISLSFEESGKLDSIISVGKARTLMKRPENGGENYLIGNKLILSFDAGVLDRVIVEGGGRGIYLPADSSVARDSTFLDSLQSSDR